MKFMKLKQFLIDVFAQTFKHSLIKNFTQNLIFQRSNLFTIVQNLINIYFKQMFLIIFEI